MVALMECVIVGLEYQGLYLCTRDNDTWLAVVTHEAYYPWVASAYFGEEFWAERVWYDLTTELGSCPFIYRSRARRRVRDHGGESYSFVRGMGHWWGSVV